MKDTIEQLVKFSDKHNVAVILKGKCGFSRDCVGLSKNDNYIDYNPFVFEKFIKANADIKDGYPLDYDQRLNAPEGVNAYHKYDCFAVMAEDENYDEALKQLLVWIKNLESQGELEIKQFSTGAEGLQAMMTGSTGHALVFKDSE